MENTEVTAEQIKNHISHSLEAYVFKPNVHNTWVEIKTMIESYLLGLYNDSAFSGSTPEESYQVLVGLGKTMTEEDIAHKIVKVSVLLAMDRPSEFVTYKFEQETE